jgi:hypothetical protein
MERRGEIPHVKKRADSKGRKQPAKKPAKKAKKIIEMDVERDRETCISLDRKVKDAERELAQWKRKGRPGKEIGPMLPEPTTAEVAEKHEFPAQVAAILVDRLGHDAAMRATRISCLCSLVNVPGTYGAEVFANRQSYALEDFYIKYGAAEAPSSDDGLDIPERLRRTQVAR